MAIKGSARLARVRELGDGCKPDRVRAAGHVSTEKGGSRRQNVTAIVESLLMGKACTAMLDLKFGDAFEIWLSCKQIRLIPAGGAEKQAGAQVTEWSIRSENRSTLAGLTEFVSRRAAVDSGDPDAASNLAIQSFLDQA